MGLERLEATIDEFIQRAKRLGRVGAVAEVLATVKGSQHIEGRHKLAAFFAFVLGHDVELDWKRAARAGVVPS